MGLLDQIEQSRRGLLDNVAQKKLERGLLAPRMQRRTPGSSPEERIAQGPIGQWADKVMSGGYLRENVDRWNAAMANSKAQAFEGAPDTGEGNIMDYFAPMAMTAYHGSPHLFDKFSLDKIGTGEGAQAYGHGLYFAENPKVAGEYKDQLTSWQLHKPDGNLFDIYEELDNPNIRAVLQKTDGDIDAAIQKANDLQKSIPNTQGAELALSDAKKLQAIKDSGGLVRPQGHLYEVDIPDEHVKNFLDWDAPLSEQPESVRDALEPIKAQVRKSFPEYADNPDITGQGLYEMLRQHRGGDSATASEALNEFGIKGIKYFDGSSRAAGEGTRNLVVFDDSIVKTLKRNNEPVGLLDDTPEFLKRQSGLAEQDYVQTDKIPEMLKRQSGLIDDSNRGVSTLIKKDGTPISDDDLSFIMNTDRWFDKGLKVGKNTKIYRGTSKGDAYQANTGGGAMSGEGRGLYTTTDKNQAKGYGEVVELDKYALPKNPIRFRDKMAYDNWVSNIRDRLGFRRMSEFENANAVHADEWIKKLDPSIDGVQIGEGHGAFFVRFIDEAE